MKSTGNDIVALNAIDIQRTILPAFYSKFVTADESELYNKGLRDVAPFHSFIWLLWSVKESVYKYLKRSQPGLIFPPAKIIIEHIVTPHTPLPGITAGVWENDSTAEEHYTGKAIFQSHTLYFSSKITAGYVASVVAGSSDLNGVYWGIKSIKATDQESQSREVRAFATEKLKTVLNSNDLLIKNDTDGCPILFSGDQPVDIPISLAHHHNFIAYSFLSGI